MLKWVCVRVHAYAHVCAHTLCLREVGVLLCLEQAGDTLDTDSDSGEALCHHQKGSECYFVVVVLKSGLELVCVYLFDCMVPIHLLQPTT